MDCDQTREWRGAVCVGILSEGWPSGKLIVSPDHIEIRSHIGNYLLPRKDIRSIESNGFFPWFRMGIRIHHAGRRSPELAFCPVLFWRRGQILEHLKQLGYKAT